MRDARRRSPSASSTSPSSSPRPRCRRRPGRARRPRRRRCAGRAQRRSRRGSRDRASAGKRTVELAPRPRPVAARRDRAAVQLDEAAHDREPEAEAALRAVERLALLHEQLEHARQQLGRDPDRRCRARAASTSSPSRARRDVDVAARLACTSRRWSAGSRTPASAARRRRRPARPARRRRRRSVCRALLEQRADDLDRARR